MQAKPRCLWFVTRLTLTRLWRVSHPTSGRRVGQWSQPVACMPMFCFWLFSVAFHLSRSLHRRREGPRPPHTGRLRASFAARAARGRPRQGRGEPAIEMLRQASEIAQYDFHSNLDCLEHPKMHEAIQDAQQRTASAGGQLRRRGPGRRGRKNRSQTHTAAAAYE